MRNRVISAFCFLLIHGTVVFADQCAMLPSPAHAANALRYLKEGETIYEYCAPCGDAVAHPVLVKQVTAMKLPVNEPHSGLQDAPGYKTVAFLMRPPVYDDGSSYYGIYVNEKGIDWAYTYVYFEGGYKNLARLVGCPCEDVPQLLPQEKMLQRDKGNRRQAF